MKIANEVAAKACLTRHFRNQGFTLIEALVALFVLSIGLLGVAGMQLSALQGAHMAYQRSLASVIAMDAQERFWSEWNVSNCPSVNTVLSGWKEYWFSGKSTDHETLSGGKDSTISLDSAGDCSYRVTVDWAEDRLATKEKNSKEGSAFEYHFSLPRKS